MSCRRYIWSYCKQLLFANLNICDEKLIVPVLSYVESTATQAKRCLERFTGVEIGVAGYIGADATSWSGGSASGCTTGAHGGGKAWIGLKGELRTAHGEHVFAGGGGGDIIKEVAVCHCFAFGLLCALDTKTSNCSHALTDLNTAAFVMVTLNVVCTREASSKDRGFVIASNIAHWAVATGLHHTHCGHVSGFTKGSVDGVRGTITVANTENVTIGKAI